MGIYKNVMELLVEEEVVRQSKALPPRMASYVNQVELVAYALNQLPALYATTEVGLEHQLKRGRERHGQTITQAVRRALAAVSRDPLRTHVPLQDAQKMPLREVLHQMRLLLRNDKVNWENLPTAVEHALVKASRGKNGSDWEAYAVAPPPRTSFQRKAARPTAPRPQDTPADQYGWDDPYHSR
ncbi:late competence development ComFB family protein [Egbenema bharatensis]|uniref:late competence development ComFB family protein n=1 Tax=Egbenema bharatensis TaxID=3463334 RepID=UPI003A83A976